jgi:thioesterase DpgC
MLLPGEESQRIFPEYLETGKFQTSGATLERDGKASVVTMCNPRYLNAGDETTLEGLETAIDLALLDPKTEVCVLRDLGLVNKLYRGLAKPEVSPEENAIEKPWTAAVEGFAIGGHCQILLAMDWVIAEEDAYLTLPARKESIIPGAANLRLARFVGLRLAREAILAERRFDCASPEGRMIRDEVVRRGDMDAAIGRTIERLTGSGLVSAAANRGAT